jgi:hypothetical protein
MRFDVVRLSQNSPAYSNFTTSKLHNFCTYYTMPLHVSAISGSYKFGGRVKRTW